MPILRSAAKKGVYTSASIQEKINKTTVAHIELHIDGILTAFNAFLESDASVGRYDWMYEFECDIDYMEALNIELSKHFDNSVSVRVYGGMAKDSLSKFVCSISWSR
jgi:hypothetical protein